MFLRVSQWSVYRRRTPSAQHARVDVGVDVGVGVSVGVVAVVVVGGGDGGGGGGGVGVGVVDVFAIDLTWTHATAQSNEARNKGSRFWKANESTHMKHQNIQLH